MLNVHLFFLKHFGCLIDEGKIRMDVRPFATAIMNEKAHPQVHLKFGLAPSLDGKPILGQSDVEVFYEKADGSCAFATYLYHVGKVAVCVMFVVDEQAWRKDLIGAWHPRSEADEFGFGDFS
jgi:hypothetical protein